MVDVSVSVKARVSVKGRFSVGVSVKVGVSVCVTTGSPRFSVRLAVAGWCEC